ncbi:MAG TPA: DUF1294 domain-containing protein [Candidatus Atribacteria bacterium]|nr:DUF1294 domain-containing protein [Candidatus Atribacteria bacterium]HPT79216.1 DUF1294 domain-containing protein [Candidatus Atribacteria bacterium]
MDSIETVLWCLAGLNLLSFLTMGMDKLKSKRHAWRIPERTLFFLAVIGGSIGICLGMLVFRHKTKKPAFRYGIPLIIGLQVLVCIMLIPRLL